jgi:hypothetical protein
VIFQKLFRDKFRVEKALLAGCHKTSSSHPSILHFSFNKAATQAVKKLLVKCGRRNGLTPALLHDYAFQHSMPYLDQLNRKQMEAYIHLFKPQGYIYSVFGGMIEGIPSITKFKVVLVVRDPRDILVSSYYSIAYSHAIPEGEKKESLLSRRKEALASDLDDHVLQHAEKLLAVFNRYEACLFAEYPSVHIARYEDMVGDYPKWLDALLSSCELAIPESMRCELIRSHEASRPSSENINKHLRKGMPGEHREKLRPQTIEALNRIFKKPLARYDYSN